MTDKLYANNMLFMALSASDIDKLAELAHLKIDLRAKEKLLHDLNKLLDQMEIINEIETNLEAKSIPKKRTSLLSKSNNLKSSY